MKTGVWILLAAICTATLPRAVWGQVTRADTAQVIYKVAGELRSEGRTADAERLYALIRERYGDTEYAALAAEALTGMFGEQETRSGRSELVAWSTVYGATLGILIPAAFGADDPEPYGLGLLIGGPAGFGLSKAWSNRYPVSSGQARAMTFGSWWGTWQGIGWQQVLNIGDREIVDCYDPGDGTTQCYTYHNESSEAPFGAMVIGGLTGMAVGTALGRARPISASSALVTNFGALWGTWFGTVAGVLAHSDNSNNFDTGQDNTVLVTTLVGGNVGLLAGAFGAPALNWTTGQAWSVHLAGVAGLVAGFGLDLLASVDDVKSVVAIPAVTSALGLAIAGATVGNDTSAPQRNGGLQMSLVDVQNGAVSIGMPTPIPTLTPMWTANARRLAPGVKVTLLNISTRP